MEQNITADQDLVTIEEFRRRILDRDRQKDPLAHMVSRPTIQAKIAAGHIEIVEANGRKWLDWNRYKNMPFRAYFGLPRQMQSNRTISTKAEVVAIYSKPITK